MTTYGVTTEGFVRKHLPDILEEMNLALKGAFGERIRLDAKSVFGRLVGCFSQPMADIWELVEAVYNSFYPSSAAGAALDGCLEIVGLSRQPATSSTVWEILGGTVGTVIPAGSIVATNQDPDSTTSTVQQFETVEELIVNTAEAVYAELDPDEPAPAGGTVYTCTINEGNTATYTSTAGQSKLDIVSAMRARVILLAQPVTATANLSSDDQPQLWINADFSGGVAVPFYVSSTNMTVSRVANSVRMESVELGEIRALANDLTNIQTPVSGWTIAYNPYDATLGREIESDSDARARRALSLAIPGAASVPAIRAKLADITGVTRAAVYHNNSDTTDSDGFLPHSIAAVVTGGEDEEIADVLWNSVAAGDAMNGTSSYTVIDDDGIAQIMKWYRPSSVLMWVRVTYYREIEEEFPETGSDLIKAAVVEAGSVYLPDNNVHPQRFIGPVFEAVSGISKLKIEVAVDSGGSPGTYQETPYAISKLQVATFATGRVTVVAG